MNIGFFTDTYLPNVDGVVRTVVDLRRELEAKKHSVWIFTSGTSRDRQFNPDPKVFFHRSVRFPLYPEYKLAVFPYLSAQKTAREKKIELIHSHAMASMGLAALSTAKSLKVPLIGTFHTLLPKATDLISWGPKSSKAVSSVLWRMYEWFYSPFDVVTAPSNHVARLLEEHGIHGVQVIPNGVDTKRFSPDSLDRLHARARLKLGEHQPLVLVAGRLSPEKNVPIIVEAARRVRQEIPLVRFVITGDGPDRKNVERAIKANRLQNTIQMAGFVPEGQIASLYRAADVLATASTFETQGLSALEALSCGTPVVGANAMALPETIRDGENGFLFAPGDSQACAEKIIAALSLEGRKRAAMESAARATAEPFALPKVADRWISLYQTTLQKTR